MIICGLKLTHDGAIALIEDGQLKFSIEMEKLNNNLRYTGIDETNIIEDVLKQNGYSLTDVDIFAVDGWGGNDKDALAIQPRLEIGIGSNKLSATNNGNPFQLDVAYYEEKSLKDDVLQKWEFEGLKIGNSTFSYESYLHVTNHIMSAYCTSPFAQRGESSYVLVWDGGMYPRLYFFDAETKKVENLGPIFLLIGNIYTIFSQHFGPFKVKGSFAKDNLSTAGKVMAYIALGQVREELFPIFDEIYTSNYDKPMGFANIFANEFKKRVAEIDVSDEDVLRTIHAYLENLLVEKLAKKINRVNKPSRNLCMAGGCALNIKWNSAVRNAGVFDEVYVPPFPNDSGSAIGVACSALYHAENQINLNWSVYSGPEIIDNQAAEDWEECECTIPELARLLHELNQPVVFLNGKAELGPRALGNRSIIGAANSPEMKDMLNDAKKRESYRPVSPICLESKAKNIFEPGSSDPYMLFDHIVKPEWLSKIPAVCHLDDTARLQTINKKDNPVVAELIECYEAISNIPVICNTSANFNGKGFFPDVFSATDWAAENGVNFVWCNNKLYNYTKRTIHSFEKEEAEMAFA